MKRFLALALGVLVLGSLSGCKQLGCNKPAKSEAPASAPSESTLPDSAPDGASESNKNEKPA